MRLSYSGIALAALATATMSPLACSLGADFDQFSQPARPSEAGAGEAGPVPDAASGADSGLPVPSYAAEVLADGPAAYFRFEDPAEAETTKDELDRHTPTVITQSAKGVQFGAPGAVGTGIALDGRAALDLGDVFDFAGKVPFTLELWVKPKGADSGGSLLDKATQAGPPNGYVFGLWADNTATFMAMSSEFSGPKPLSLRAESEAPLPTTSFTHLVVTVAYKFERGNATLYVNGVASPIGGDDNQADVPDSDAHLLIGEYLEGTLDEVAIYEKALSPERILAHYDAGKR